MEATNTADVLFYDGKCSLCLREMHHLRQLKRDSLELTDIHSISDFSSLPARQTLLEILHLKRGHTWLTGVDASVAAWQHTPYGALWRWMRLPLIAPLMDMAYRRWARWRFRRLYPASCSGTQTCD